MITTPSGNYESPLPLGVRPEELFTENQVDRAKLREQVSNCKECHSDRAVCMAPRFGTGYQDAKLMLIGQNPPQEESRCLNGAWLVHNPEVKKGAHEYLIQELLLMLKVSTKEVFATNAFKCPTLNNEVPLFYSQTGRCVRRFLQFEVAWARPRVVLAFGTQTRSAVLGMYHLDGAPVLGNLYKYPGSVREVTPIGKVITQFVTNKFHLVLAPHPSVVGRFLDKKSWIACIQDAYAEALAYDGPRPLLHHEVAP